MTHRRNGKAAVIVTAVALLLATAAATGWILRDRIIERLSGPILAKFELEITDVSLDAIAGGDAAISYLELHHSTGTTITIEDLVLNVRRVSDDRRRHRAGRITIALAETSNDGPLDVANLVRQAISVPNAVPPVDLAVGELLVPPYAALSDVAWSVFVDRQVVHARLDKDRVDLELRALTPTRHEVQVNLAAETGVSERAHVQIQDGRGHVELRAESQLEMAVLEHRLEQVGLLPDGLGIDTAEALVNLHADIPDDPAEAMSLKATIAPAAPWQLRAPDDLIIGVNSLSSARLEASYPSQTWALIIDDLQVSLTGRYAGAIEAETVRCEHGITCTLGATMSLTELLLPDGNVDLMQISAMLELKSSAADTGMQVVLKPGAKIKSTGIAFGDSTIGNIEANIGSGADIAWDAAGLRVSADSIDAVMQRLTLAGATASAPLVLERAVLEVHDGEITGTTGLFAPAIDLFYADSRLTLPGIRGDVKLVDRRLTAQLSTVGLREEGSIRLTSDLAADSGEIRVVGAINAFADRPLTRIFDRLPAGFDLTSGELGLDAGFTWRPRRSLRGEARLWLNDTAGFYSAIAFTGVNTEVGFDYHARHGLSADPATMTAAFVDVGIGMAELKANYQLRPNDSAVDVTELEFSAFGGTVRTDPFSLDTGFADQTVMVRVDSLDLTEVLKVQDFETIDVTGRIDAELPVTFGTGGFRVDRGQLTGVAPGGVIHYSQGAAAPQSTGGAMDIVTQALSNFEYDTLSSEVTYTEDGDLILKMQLMGRNPDMESNRPIVLNLGIENNIPQMLRSLQASRSVRDVLEQRLNR